jgi:hypothetical protein
MVFDLEFFKHKIGSCTCAAKTSEPKYHNELCYYRLLSEAEDRDKANSVEAAGSTADLRNMLSPIKTYLGSGRDKRLPKHLRQRMHKDAMTALLDIEKYLEG